MEWKNYVTLAELRRRVNTYREGGHFRYTSNIEAGTRIVRVVPTSRLTSDRWEPLVRATFQRPNGHKFRLYISKFDSEREFV